MDHQAAEPLPERTPARAESGPRRARRVPRSRRRRPHLLALPHLRRGGVRAADEYALHGARRAGDGADLDCTGLTPPISHPADEADCEFPEPACARRLGLREDAPTDVRGKSLESEPRTPKKRTKEGVGGAPERGGPLNSPIVVETVSFDLPWSVPFGYRFSRLPLLLPFALL